MKLSFKKPSEKVSERMRKVKSRDTKLEKEMEKILGGLDVRYEKQPDIEGHPDFRMEGTSVLIFCDSSFWHGRREKEVSGEAFKKNRELWKAKLSETRKRDARTNRNLRRAGWRVLRFWDTDIQKKPEKVREKLSKELNKNVE